MGVNNINNDMQSNWGATGRENNNYTLAMMELVFIILKYLFFIVP